MEQKITLVGMEQFLNKMNDSLFKNVVFPTGINKEIFINSLMLDVGECEALYANPYYMKEASTNWARKWNRTFEKWVAALDIDFEPLYNYDRYEEYTDTEETTGTENGTASATGSSSNERTSTDESSATSNQNSSVVSDTANELKVSAYDMTDYVPKEKNTGTVDESNEVTGESSQTNNGSISDIGTTSNTSENETNKSENRTLTHTAHLYGNIGTTKSTEMLLDYLSAEEWNIYNHMIDLYAQELVILVY